ncbi:hypothetical protein TrST_g13935 [Triparma strigata]|uniref:Uncharacterized protein n=1 Tax=Triparma strigata TaxID=1606541 RepID=A0A9W7AZA9_9STRA|nr:hypothetical protein TrST_g13935 [Triparma strigata]
MTGFGNDIYAVSGGSVTVHSTCPPDLSGTPEAGSNLNTRACHIGCLYPGTILGTLKSFDLGTCSMSCPAGQSFGGSGCFGCGAGKYSGEGSTSCSR